MRLARREALQQGQGESGGFTGAGLREADNVAAFEDQRDGLRLNGGGFRVTLVDEGGEDRRY